MNHIQPAVTAAMAAVRSLVDHGCPVCDRITAVGTASRTKGTAAQNTSQRASVRSSRALATGLVTI
jgi:hypothetical protein